MLKPRGEPNPLETIDFMDQLIEFTKKINNPNTPPTDAEEFKVERDKLCYMRYGKGYEECAKELSSESTEQSL